MSTCNGIVGAGSNLLNGDLTVVIGRESHEVNAHPDGIDLETATVTNEYASLGTSFSVFIFTEPKLKFSRLSESLYVGRSSEQEVMRSPPAATTAIAAALYVVFNIFIVFVIMNYAL